MQLQRQKLVQFTKKILQINQFVNSGLQRFMHDMRLCMLLNSWVTFIVIR